MNNTDKEKKKQGRCKRGLLGALSQTLHYGTTNGLFYQRTYFSTYLQSAQSVKARLEVSCSSPALCDTMFPIGDRGLALLCPYKTTSGQRTSFNADIQPD